MIVFLVPILLLSLGSIISLSTSYLGTQLPWVKADVSINNLSYSMRVPLDMTLFSCVSDICKDYNAASLYFKDESPSSRGLLSSSGSMISGLGSQMFQSIRAKLRTFQRPFVKGSKITIPLILIKAVICVLCLIWAIIIVKWDPNNDCRGLLTLWLVGLLAESFSITIYVLLTLSHLQGGEYLIGFWIVTYSAILGTIFAVISMALIGKKDSSFQYEVL